MAASETLSGQIGEKWPIILTAFLALAIATAYPHVLRAIQIAKIPTVGTELGGEDKRRQAYISSARRLYNDGYHKVRLNWPIFQTHF